MKRSKMIELIVDIRNYYGVVTDETEFADFLLEQIEKAGMLPPYNNIVLGGSTEGYVWQLETDDD